MACLKFAYLAGAPGPQTKRRAGFEVDGVQTKVRLDYGTGLVEHRGLVTLGRDPDQLGGLARYERGSEQQRPFSHVPTQDILQRTRGVWAIRVGLFVGLSES
jgi:hypothetical protein